jgi:hypothetical protein
MYVLCQDLILKEIHYTIFSSYVTALLQDTLNSNTLQW